MSKSLLYVLGGFVTILALSPILLLLYVMVTYEEPKTKLVYTLVCSGITITQEQDYLHTTRGGLWEFRGGSYTPRQGEVCIVQRKEVNK